MYWPLGGLILNCRIGVVGPLRKGGLLRKLTTQVEPSSMIVSKYHHSKVLSVRLTRCPSSFRARSVVHGCQGYCDVIVLPPVKVLLDIDKTSDCNNMMPGLQPADEFQIDYRNSDPGAPRFDDRVALGAQSSAGNLA